MIKFLKIPNVFFFFALFIIRQLFKMIKIKKIPKFSFFIIRPGQKQRVQRGFDICCFNGLFGKFL